LSKKSRSINTPTLKVDEIQFDHISKASRKSKCIQSPPFE